MKRVSRVLGGLTAAYGTAIIFRPKLLAAPCGLTDGDGEAARNVRVLVRVLGARDVISGVAMAAAPAGKLARLAIGIRVAADVTDALAFGTSLPERNARLKAAAVAGTWATLCGMSARGHRKR